MEQLNKIEVFYNKLKTSSYGPRFSKWEQNYLRKLIESAYKDQKTLDLKCFCKSCPKPPNSAPDTNIDFWLFRGWSELDARLKAKEAISKVKRGNSPFSQEFYLEKGFTEEEAIFEAGKRIPTRAEYYIHKFGLNKEEAEILAKERKFKNNKLGADKSGKRNIKDLRFTSVLCIEYWLLKGYSREEAALKLKEEYSKHTFSLIKCIKKHGLEEGSRIHKDRQIKWQNTLNSKPQEEIDLIDLKKNVWTIDSYLVRGFTREKAIELCASAIIKRQLGYSQESINKLKSILPDNIFNNGMHSENEYYIYANNRHYFYDFRYKDLIIEYHGSAYHASPYLEHEQLNEWKHPFEKTGYKESYEKDKIKRELAVTRGFTYLEIYNPMPVNEYNNVIEILNNKCKEFN